MRGLLAASLFSFSCVGLTVVTAPAAHAAEPCAVAPNNGWTATGQWGSGDGGTSWTTSNDWPQNDTLTHKITNLPTSGAQFTFDFQYNRARNPSTMTVSYNGVVYATVTTPAQDAAQGATWTASNGATVSPTSVPTAGTSTPITITLPDNVPASADLVLTATRNSADGYADDLILSNFKANGTSLTGSTDCADLSVTKFGPAAVQPNGSVEYSIYVTNNGPLADDYTVTDQLPAGLAGATTSTPGCSITSGTLTCNGTNLGVDSTATIKVQGTAPSTAGDTLANTASVTGKLPDQDTSNNTSGTVNTNVDDTLGGPLADPLVAGGTIGTAGLAFVGIAARRRRAARVTV
ncbi:DUF11 domain-containing protein [Streptomyces tubercidicus]